MDEIMGRHQFSAALKQLEEFGFIERTQRGGLFNRKNLFRLSEDWRKVSSAESAPIQVSNQHLDKCQISTWKAFSGVKSALVEGLLSKVQVLNQHTIYILPLVLFLKVGV
jgi:hypothetical protein